MVHSKSVENKIIWCGTFEPERVHPIAQPEDETNKHYDTLVALQRKEENGNGEGARETYKFRVRIW